MPKYLFTSDLRISELPSRIKSVAAYVQSGRRISDISDKSDNNNAATLAFYFNLYLNSEVCKAASVDPGVAIRNYILKFQFPNTRTSESLNDSILEKNYLAPYRAIARILYRMAESNTAGVGEISLDEILYFVFCNKDVYGNPSFEADDVINLIRSARNKGSYLEQMIRRNISWNQYGRQVREMMTVITYGYSCFHLKKGILYFSMADLNSSNFKSEFEKLLTYNYIWFPSDKTNFNKSSKEFSSYMDTKENAYTVIDFKSKNKREKVEVGDVDNSSYRSFITAIRTKPFILLAGISGTGKSRIVRRLAQATDDIDKFENDDDRWACQRPSNFELIQVKPNWHNSMDVIGFKSNIDGQHYEFTPFLDFVAKAWSYPKTPFFLCLDEMNLAPVEEYFAEFLSAIESRTLNEEGEYETDPIVKALDGFGQAMAGDMVKHFNESGAKISSKVENIFRKKGITLPPNLIVMGTVNMDETTFSFSRKVLDRAMSIEMNEVDYENFLSGKTDLLVPKLTKINELLINRPISAQEIKDDIDSGVVMSFLIDVNSVLEDTPFMLGYRAANEALLYVAADKEIGKQNIIAALDDFTLMKILSRIEGDDAKLKTKDDKPLLDELYQLFAKKDYFGSLEKSKTLKKIQSMINTLGRDHFVSFWG